MTKFKCELCEFSSQFQSSMVVHRNVSHRGGTPIEAVEVDTTAIMRVRKYTYYTTPKYKWTELFKEGGCFSNSGEYRSLKKCIDAAVAQCERRTGMQWELITVSLDDDGNPVESAPELIEVK